MNVFKGLSILLTALTVTSCAQHQKPATNSTGFTAYDARLTQYDYPRSTDFYKFTSQNQKLEMAYILAQPQNHNGQTVLLLHGKNFSAAYWESTIAILLDKGYQVLAPDQIGFGKSSKPSAYQFSFQALAENTKALMESLKIQKAHVVGHSMGGMLAARFTLMYPDSVEKLVLVNPIGLEDWKTMAPSRSVDQLYKGELSSTPEKIKQYQQTVYFDGKWKKEYDPLVQVLSGWTRHPEYSQVAWNAALTADMIWNQPVLYEFPLIKKHTLLIIGTRDRTAIGRDRVSETEREKMGRYDLLGKKAARSFPKSKLIEFKNVGHMPQVEAFEDYKKALLGFL